MPFLGPIQLIFAQAPLFALVMVRLSGMMIVAPLLSTPHIPLKIKAMIVLMLSVVVFPLVGPVDSPPVDMAGLIVAAGGEMVIGLSMGFFLMILMAGVELGANLVSQQMGLTLAQVIDPMTEITTDVLGQIYLLLSTLLYILMNGHLVLIKALARTFQTIPLMHGLAMGEILDELVTIMTLAFTLGIRVAGPALAAIFLATLALGFISRTMPQLNILVAGFPIRIMLSMILMMASVSSFCWLFQDHLLMALNTLGMFFY